MHNLSMNLVSILALAGVPIVIIAIGLVAGRMVGSSSLARPQQSPQPGELHVVHTDVERVA